MLNFDFCRKSSDFTSIASLATFHTMGPMDAVFLRHEICPDTTRYGDKHVNFISSLNFLFVYLLSVCHFYIYRNVCMSASPLV